VADRLEAEDLARARWYSFFSRWFLASPDRQAIDLFIPASAGSLHDASAQNASAQDTSPPNPSLHESLPADATNEAAASPWLASAWAAFAAAVAGESLETIRSSYDDTFISVGEAPVSLHASVYLTGFANERPLAEVRQWLAGQGIQSSREGLLTEDHLGLLCEAMAWLIVGRGDREAGAGDAAMAGGESREGAEGEQQYLFQHFIAPVCDEFCQRLSETPGAGIYRELGHLFAAFCAVERQAFEIER
jgi:TorA maturation chaperone TorD